MALPAGTVGGIHPPGRIGNGGPACDLSTVHHTPPGAYGKRRRGPHVWRAMRHPIWHPSPGVWEMRYRGTPPAPGGASIPGAYGKWTVGQVRESPRGTGRRRREQMETGAFPPEVAGPHDGGPFPVRAVKGRVSMPEAQAGCGDAPAEGAAATAGPAGAAGKSRAILSDGIKSGPARGSKQHPDGSDRGAERHPVRSCLGC